VKRETRLSKQRERRRLRVRNAVKRNSTRPRLAVFRSLKHIYAQIVEDGSDERGSKTLVAASSLEKDLRGRISYGGNKEAAAAVGRVLAERALAAGIKQVAFDRREYKYHGRIAALADSARDAGLDLGPKKVAPEPEPEPAKPEKKKSKAKPKAK
jgi:large subunit ribosomal protein L18